MKIKAIETSTKKPLMNMKIQLQIRGKESGFLSVTTDATGTIQLDDKYKDHQIAALFNGKQGTWTTATDSATLQLDTQRVGIKEK